MNFGSFLHLPSAMAHFLCFNRLCFVASCDFSRPFLLRNAIPREQRWSRISVLKIGVRDDGTFAPENLPKTKVEPNLGYFQVPAVGVQWLDTERGLRECSFDVLLWCVPWNTWILSHCKHATVMLRKAHERACPKFIICTIPSDLCR